LYLKVFTIVKKKQSGLGSLLRFSRMPVGNTVLIFGRVEKYHTAVEIDDRHIALAD
jgi:hypothetical protein